MSLIHKLKLILFGRRRYERGESIKIYRCTDCGYVAFSLGGLHGHIESHRPFYHFWRIGWDVEYLWDRTEELQFTV